MHNIIFNILITAYWLYVLTLSNAPSQNNPNVEALCMLIVFLLTYELLKYCFKMNLIQSEKVKGRRASILADITAETVLNPLDLGLRSKRNLIKADVCSLIVYLISSLVYPIFSPMLFIKAMKYISRHPYFTVDTRLYHH